MVERCVLATYHPCIQDYLANKGKGLQTASRARQIYKAARATLRGGRGPSNPVCRDFYILMTKGNYIANNGSGSRSMGLAGLQTISVK